MRKTIITIVVLAVLGLTACKGAGPAGNPPSPIGNLEAAATNYVGGVEVSGWTFDPNTVGPIEVRVYINGAFAGSAMANGSRPDVGAVYPGYGPNHGYAFIVPSGAGPGAQVCTYGINFGPGANTTLGCFNLAEPTPPPPPPPPPPGGGGNGAPTAICNDGTYSYSQTRSGTCSHHGGVRQWL
jgi:hypothetical protein